MNSETICAIATASGGAIGIVRVSGPQALAATASVCNVHLSHLPAAGTFRLCHIYDEEELLDDAIVSVYRAPHSYTGEDCVEISCHGSSYILQRLLRLLVHAGCRVANPGEFTQRAFLNGKINLSQAEAIADLIASSNRTTHQLALAQLRGGYSSELTYLREQLLHLTTLLELELDFSDHEDLLFADRDELLRLARTIDTHIEQLIYSYDTGRILKKGIPVAIVGKTNVGKSTLLNRLLHDDRAIVSDLHGTTRDTLEEQIEIQGVNFRIIDTAGLRQTHDEVEQIGIQRTLQTIEKARIILWVFDIPPSSDDIKEMQSLAKGKSILYIRNKADIQSFESATFYPSNTLSISAKTGSGLTELESAIYTAADIPSISEQTSIVTSVRHYNALILGHKGILRVQKGLSTHQPADLVAEDLRYVLSNLSEITGQGVITSQETLNNIFSNFCIGK